MYVLDRKQQVSLIREMTQLRKDKEAWEVYYHHPTTNVMWKSYFPKATKNKTGPKILRTEPVPERLEERLDNCLVDSSPENALGLGIELSVQPERWERLMEIIEQNYRSYDRQHLPFFLKELGIEQYKVLFDEIGYPIGESSLSEKKFDELAYRSKKIRFKRFWFF